MTLTRNARLVILLGLYVAQGLPTGIYNQALPAILRHQGVSLQVISLTALLALPWALKVFWAPVVDRWHHPRFGRARSWIVPLQLACTLLIGAIAFFQPERLKTTAGIVEFFLMMFLLNLFAATQDVATDGLAVRSLSRKERSLGNSVQVTGYRLGLIVGGGVLLYLLGAWTWVGAFLLMGFILLLLTLPLLLYPEPPADQAIREQTEYKRIFLTFVRRPGVRSWLWVLVSYKIADSFGSAMVKPMLVDMGFSLQQLGIQISAVGSLATVIGALLGGWLTTRWGRYPCLLGFGGLQALGLGAYGLLSFQWQPGQAVDPLAVYAINALEHLASGLATVALLTVVMDHSRHQHAGADFTLQVSILAICGGMAHLLAGQSAVWLGYTGYYAVAMGLGVLLLAPVVFWGRDAGRGVSAL